MLRIAGLLQYPVARDGTSGGFGYLLVKAPGVATQGKEPTSEVEI